VGLPIQTVGVAELLSPKAPFGDPMTRERFRPHGFLTWRLVIHPQGGKLIKRITAKKPTLWAREWIGTRLP
jgi:hypothetical protein